MVNSTGGGADVFICRRPTTDTPSEFDADWYHLPRGATVLEATTTASPYRSGTLVYVGASMYFCHTSVPSPGVTAANIPANANFVLLSGAGFFNNSFDGLGTQADPLSLDVAGSTFPTIPLTKGGTGAVSATGARLTLGLGTAAVRDVGDAASDVAVLQGDASFTAGHLAPGGGVGQVLTRTATGKEWMSGGSIDTNYYVESATFGLSGNDLTVTLPRTGGLADVVSNVITLPGASGGGVIVPTSVVHQGSNDFAITTGRSFTSIPTATQILFQPPVTNTGSIRVNVDSVGFHAVNLANSPGVIESVPSGVLRLGDVYILIWDHNNVEFGIHPLTFGLSAWYSTGTAANEIPVLGTDGELASGRLAQGGTDGQVLQRTSTGQEWGNLDASSSAFPVVPVSKGGTGSTTAGAARGALGLGTAATYDIGPSTGNIPILSTGGHLQAHLIASFGQADQVLTWIPTGTGTEWRDAQGLTTVATDGATITGDGTTGDPLVAVTGGAGDITGVIAGTGLDGGGLTGTVTLNIADQGITETLLANRAVSVEKMSILGTPTTGQVIAYDGSDMEWTTPSGGGTPYTDADVDARLIDRLQNAPQSGASFFDRLLMWDDTNPTELRSFDMGQVRLYTTVGWAQPTSADVLPIAKIASGGKC